MFWETRNLFACGNICVSFCFSFCYPLVFFFSLFVVDAACLLLPLSRCVCVCVLCVCVLITVLLLLLILKQHIIRHTSLPPHTRQKNVFVFLLLHLPFPCTRASSSPSSSSFCLLPKKHALRHSPFLFVSLHTQEDTLTISRLCFVPSPPSLPHSFHLLLLSTPSLPPSLLVS